MDLVCLMITEYKKLKILEAHRNQYYSESNQLINKNSVRLTFEGAIVPNYVQLDNLRIRVLFYVPSVLYCKKCSKYGHTEKFCDRDYSKCAFCKKMHRTDSCTEKDIKCRDCNLNHVTGDKLCTKRKEI